MKGLTQLRESLRRNMVAVSLFLSLGVLGFCASNINFGPGQWEDILEADARGYYAYLPAFFIYNDPGFHFFEEIEVQKYPRKHLFYDYRKRSGESWVNKYFCGTAIAELPFFLMAHAATLLSGGEADGYTRLYFIWINIAALCYLGLAFLFLIRIFRLYGIRDEWIAFLIPVMAFGTNIFLYTVLDPGMSHIYSLAFFSMFIYYALKLFNGAHGNYLYVLAFLLGMIILIRPSNGLILFSLPFLSVGTTFEFAKFLKQSYLKVLVSAAIVAGICGIQLLCYKAASGSFMVYAYSEERFYFNAPHILEILFSYRKGLFLYTPVLLFSFTAYGVLYRRLGAKAVAAHALFLLLVTYVLSCWWMWWYGGGFSGRVFIEYFPFFFIPLAMGLNAAAGIWRKTLLTVMVVLTLICQIQIYQYRHYQIHWENTDKAMYWKNFLRIDKLL